jgi:acetyltransferase-like isoleucine patch superfamily enzyme
MEIMGFELRLGRISEKREVKKTISLSKSIGEKHLNLIQLFEHYYHIETVGELIKSVFEDIITSIFMGSGSGLFSSLLRGLYFRLFFNYRLPAFIGKSFRIINRSKVKIGRVFWAKDSVTLFAGSGPLIIGDNCVLAERSTIWSGKEEMHIGNNFTMGIASYISAIAGSVRIGNDVMVADHVSFYTWNHEFSKGGKPFRMMGGIVKGISIGNNCWFGTGCIVLPGAKLGNNCVVAAGSVLTDKVYSDNSLIAGIPAKIIRKIL